MLISQAIKEIKGYCSGMKDGKPVSDDRDKILYGDPEQECKGIVSCVFGSIDVIKKAIGKGCNLIIVNESFFWSHGDPTEWLENNKTFIEKKKLLDDYNICVWRCHEYARGGVRYGDGYGDPINIGFLNEMGWLDKVVEGPVNDPLQYMWPVVKFDGETVREISKQIIDKLGLNGIKIIGDPNKKVYQLFIPPGSIMGYPYDKEFIRFTEENNYDAVIGLEVVDNTLASYVRDCSCTSDSKAIITVGHFSFEEMGSKYSEVWMKEALSEDVGVYYINSGDPFQYVIGGKE